uniref:Leucine-rich repeat protein n=1 Tax=Paramoeba aestuarina TaxID=180227 RepID=A0A7S4KTR8_9EUKA|mmetsp:Transcript_25248/g.39406  ORF Transcript_25248/g.39406 Transcript_25248/m.39406 type:complete len:250 (+) Transcript_25248:48-797(+)
MQSLCTLSASELNSSLGRIEREYLPQETLMELLLDKIENKARICGVEEIHPPLAQWTGVKLYTDGRVHEISWGVKGLIGEIDLQLVPESVTAIMLWENTLHGSLNLSCLPDGMKELYCSQNAFTGTIDLIHLPSSMTGLSASFNELSGSLNLQQLPRRLLTLYLNNNAFSGSISLINLPSTMTTLNLSMNDLSGKTNFENLPTAMEYLNVSNTQLSGEIKVFSGESGQRGKRVCAEYSNIVVIKEKYTK